MPNLSLGLIEVLGLPAAVEAADVACKTADVQLIGYETTDGMGMVAVKFEGQVSAVKAAVAAGSAAAARVSKVFATSVIARPSEQLPPIVFTKETVGYSAPVPAPAAAPVAETRPEPAIAPVETAPEPVVAPVVAPEPVAAKPVETAAEPVVAPLAPRTSPARTRSNKK